MYFFVHSQIRILQCSVGLEEYQNHTAATTGTQFFFGWVGCETVFIMATVRSFLMIFKCLRVFFGKGSSSSFFLSYCNLVYMYFLVFIANAVYTNEFQCSNGFLTFVISHTSSFISFTISKDMHSIQVFCYFYDKMGDSIDENVFGVLGPLFFFFSNIVEPCRIQTLTKDQSVIGIG